MTGRNAIDARRLRAAMAYGQAPISALVEATGLSDATIRRIRNGDRAIKPEEAHAIARVCGVPFSWLTHGLWDDLGGTVRERAFARMRDAASLPSSRSSPNAAEGETLR